MTRQHDPLTRFGRSDGANDEVPLPALSASEAPLNAMASDRDFTFADAPNSFGYRCGSDRQALATAPVKKDEMLQPFIASGLYPRLTSGLPRATQLPPIPVLPPVKDQKAAPTRVSIKLKERMAAPKPPDGGHVFLRGMVMVLLVAGAIAAAAAGYFVASGPPSLDSMDVPTSTTIETQFTTAGSEAEHEQKLIELPSPQMLSATEDRTTGDTNAITESTFVDQGHPEATPSIATVAQDAKPPIGKDSELFAETSYDSTCLASASEVREKHPEAWPSWTLRAPGHQGTKCWYAATRATAHDHR
jgi:hypothetical protein